MVVVLGCERLPWWTGGSTLLGCIYCEGATLAVDTVYGTLCAEAHRVMVNSLEADCLGWRLCGRKGKSSETRKSPEDLEEAKGLVESEDCGVL